MLAAIASLVMSGYVSAHHPSEDMNPNFDTIDENISDMHIIVVDGLLEDAEDDDLMASTAQGSDAIEAPNSASGDGANSSQVSNAATTPDSAPGMSSATQSRGGRQ